MDGRFSLQDSTVGIVGLGLMGGSLALALKDRCRSVVASDTDSATLEEACRQGAVAAAHRDPARILPGADLVILATPVPAIIDLLAELPKIVHNPCIVMDVGSVKCPVVSAMSRLSESFEAVGGHPLCGKETLSFAHAEAELYQGANFFLTPLERTTPRAMSAAHQVIQAIGAKPVTVDAEEHDRLLAATSHVPFLLSSALALAVPDECAPFAGPGFRSTSRLAGTSASMMLGVLQCNRGNVLHALHRLQRELAKIEAALGAEDYPKLEDLLNDARGKHRILVQ